MERLSAPMARCPPQTASQASEAAAEHAVERAETMAMAMIQRMMLSMSCLRFVQKWPAMARVYGRVRPPARRPR